YQCLSTQCGLSKAFRVGAALVAFPTLFVSQGIGLPLCERISASMKSPAFPPLLVASTAKTLVPRPTMPFRLKSWLLSPPPSPTFVPFTHSTNSSSQATIAAPVEGSSAPYSLRNQTLPSGAFSAALCSMNQNRRCYLY